MAAYSQDLRDRVLNGLQRGEGATSMARRLDVSPRWVYHVQDRYEHGGARTSLRLGGSRRSRVADMEPQIRTWLTTDTDVPLVELSARVARHGAVIKTTAWWHQLDKWHLALKKTAARQRASARRRAGGTSRVDSTPAHA